MTDEKPQTFWQAMINKYEGRNSHVERQQMGLRQRMGPKQGSKPVPLITNINGNTRGSPMDVMKTMLGRSVTDVTTLASVFTEFSNNAAQPEMKEHQTSVDSNFNSSQPPPLSLENDLNLSDVGNLCKVPKTQESNLSTDFQCLSKIQELTIRERQMKHQILEMEQREQAYIETLRQADEMWANMEKDYEKQLSDVQQNEDTSRLQFEQMNQLLISKNARLNKELNDLKSELRQCVDKVEGPISCELENERRKTEQLEMDLTSTAKAMVQKERASVNAVKDLQEQINSASINVCDLKAENEQLQHEMGILQCKYDQLQKDLINQKISEARTLERLNKGVHIQQTEQIVRNIEHFPMELEDENLFATDRRSFNKTFLAIDECAIYTSS